jgi:hypothetical protein
LNAGFNEFLFLAEYNKHKLLLQAEFLYNLAVTSQNTLNCPEELYVKVRRFCSLQKKVYGIDSLAAI